MMLDGSLQIPEPCPLTTDSETRVTYVIIGDEGFGLHENLRKPFSGTHLDVNKKERYPTKNSLVGGNPNQGQCFHFDPPKRKHAGIKHVTYLSEVYRMRYMPRGSVTSVYRSRYTAPCVTI
ncbi:hypothetical protein EVAR_64416_1 [Eumeta japonica]|uniref:DDE Tnp4 domain-containing protein n=1 Tax=Eumeta variegata TaxID=151549 RepID=A0A4C1ZZC4_EUMVA|nr:hypothetical protein EVAR_64416_1 [Eumeta japonica]